MEDWHNIDVCNISYVIIEHVCESLNILKFLLKLTCLSMINKILNNTGWLDRISA